MQNRMTRYLPLLYLMSLGACSSTPSPEPALAAGTASVEAARSSGAPELASVEINNARSKLEKARLLAQAGKQKEAIRMAEQADVDAQLARARASSERSMRAVTELDASLQTLKEELNRMPNAAAPPPTGAPSMSSPQQTPR